LKEGYSGQAPVSSEELNLCLVGKPRSIEELKRWAVAEFKVSPEQSWRTITPLTRSSLGAVHDNLFLIGDVARVVEPFTGEGIFYALRSGELAAQAIIRIAREENRQSVLQDFVREHDRMYRGRLWINRLARTAVLSPRIGSVFVGAARIYPGALRFLTRKITG